MSSTDASTSRQSPIRRPNSQEGRNKQLVVSRPMKIINHRSEVTPTRSRKQSPGYVFRNNRIVGMSPNESLNTRYEPLIIRSFMYSASINRAARGVLKIKSEQCLWALVQVTKPIRRKVALVDLVQTLPIYPQMRSLNTENHPKYRKLVESTTNSFAV